jgi:hypothetical protein
MKFHDITILQKQQNPVEKPGFVKLMQSIIPPGW